MPAGPLRWEEAGGAGPQAGLDLRPFLGSLLSTCLGGTGPVAQMEAVKNPGSKLAKIICHWRLSFRSVWKKPGPDAITAGPHTFHCPAGLVELCTLKPVAKTHESLG